MKVRCLAPLLAAFIACSGDPAEPAVAFIEETLITTSETSYTLEKLENFRRARIAIGLTNTSADTLYIANCGGNLAPMFERRTSSGWTPSLPSSSFMCQSGPIVVAPGTVLADSVWLSGAVPGSGGGPTFMGADIEGEYRMVMTNVYTRHAMNGDPFPEVPRRRVTSNSFRVEVDE